MHRLYSEYHKSFPSQGHIFLRHSLLPIILGRTEFFYNGPTDVCTLARDSFFKLCARVWRLNWFDIPYNLDPNDTIKDAGSDDKLSLIEVSLDIIKTHDNLYHITTACNLLIEIIHDMTVSDGSVNIAKEKKIANMLKEHHLLHIFTASVDTAKKFLNTDMPGDQSVSKNLLNTSLRLCLSTLSFNYTTLYYDEASEDLAPIPLKSTWSDALHFAPLFFQLYKRFPAPYSTKALEVLVYLVSIRSIVLKTEEAQIDYLKSLFTNIGEILEKAIGFDNHMNRHNFCRLLARLKNNYRLDQFGRTKMMKPIFELYSNFCVNLFKSYETDLSTAFYVFNFWNKVAHGIQTINVNRDIEKMVQNISIIFLDAMIQRESVPGCETLLKANELNTLLEYVGRISKCWDYAPMAKLLQDRLIQFGSIYNDLATSHDKEKIATVERQLSWIIYFLGPIIYCKTSLCDNEDLWNGKLMSSVFFIFNIHVQRLTTYGISDSSHSIEMALLSFLVYFIKSYFTSDSAELHKQLSESHGFTSPAVVCEKIFSKILSNLEIWQDNEIIEKTFDVFLSLTQGRQSCQALTQLELTRNVIFHHNEINLKVSKRLRTQFFKTLGKIVYANVEVGLYDEFINAFQISLNHIQTNLNNNYYEDLRMVGPLVCNLRGVLGSCLSNKSYEMFFDWFYKGGYFHSVIAKSLSYFQETDIQIAFCILRFVADLTDNAHRRISFPITSTDGISLYKDVANILIEFGQLILRSSSLDDPDIIVKSVYHYCKIFSNLIDGEYCNIGCFLLYGDDVLYKLLSTTFGVLFHYPIEEIANYSKVEEKVYCAVSMLSRFNFSELYQKDNNRILGNPSQTIGNLLETIKLGYRSRHLKSINHCSISIEHLAVAHMNQTKKRSRYPTILDSSHLKVMAQILFQLFDIIITDKKSVVSVYMYKSMFFLIQLLPEVFEDIKTMMIKSQEASSNEKGAKMIQSFAELTDSIERNTTQDNQERFSRNISCFRNGVKQFIDLNMFYKYCQQFNETV